MVFKFLKKSLVLLAKWYTYFHAIRVICNNQDFLYMVDVQYLAIIFFLHSLMACCNHIMLCYKDALLNMCTNVTH